MQKLFFLGIVFLLVSCLKEDKLVPAHIAGDIETVQIEIGYPYVNQVYYNCKNNQVIATNTKYDWDLAFECSSTGFHVLNNTAKGEFTANMGSVDFATVTSVSNVTWLWDVENGHLDSTAIGDWKNSNNVYILDLQYNANGSHLGYKKIQFISVNATEYTFKASNLDGSSQQTYTVTKNANLNFIHFSFSNGGQTLELEPNKEDWDLLFTNHYHKFSNLPMPFVLTQALINKHSGVLVAEDNNNLFQTTTLADTNRNLFTNNWDEIGFDWKIRNSQDNSYTIDNSKSFIVKTAEGLYYKIRFIDFYNASGLKGYPTFEIQKL